MMPIKSRQPKHKTFRTLANGSSVLALALVFAAGSGCSTPAGDPDPGSTGGKGGGTGGSRAGGTGGSSSPGTGGSSAAGGSTASGGTSGGSSGGSSGSSGGTSGGSSGGSTGAGGSGTGGGGGDTDASAPADTGMPPVSSTMPVCTDMPMVPPPALKRGTMILIPGKTQPGQVVGVPGEDTMYVIGHTSGDVHIIQGGKLAPTKLLHVGVAGGGNGPEQGLLSMALHPNFATNHLFYIYYTASNENMTIEEYERMTPTTAMKKATLFDQPRVNGSPYHNGGSIYFNPKDTSPLLYLSVGNNNNPAESRKVAGPVGGIFRFDVATKMKEKYAYGLRNPYRMSIDRLTGDMWIGEVANAAGGSVLFLANGNAGVKDFGYGSGGEIAGGISGFQGGNAALIGGVVYRGTKIKGLCGRYFFGMHANGTIKSIVQQGGQRMGAVTDHPELTIPGQISSFGEDGEGEIWMSSRSSDAIFRIEAAAP
jgi:hypothetical protein